MEYLRSVVIQQQTPEPTQAWSSALQQYFWAIGFEAGYTLHHHISERTALDIGGELQQLVRAEKVTQHLFDQTAERLYERSGTIHFSLARTYTLVSNALGYPTCVDARKALRTGGGVLPKMPRRGVFQLEVFVARSSDS